jgi:hypothetical protein
MRRLHVHGPQNGRGSLVIVVEVASPVEGPEYGSAVAATLPKLKVRSIREPRTFLRGMDHRPVTLSGRSP